MKYECAYDGKPVSRPPSNKGNLTFCDNECKQRFYGDNDRTRAENLKFIVRYISKHDGATRKEIHENCNINNSTLYTYLRELRDDGKIKLIDPHTRAVYKVTP